MRLLDEWGGQVMRREDLKNWTRDMLKDRIIELGGIIEQWKRDNEKMLQITEIIKEENDELKAANTALKQRIKDLENVCDGSCFSDEEDGKDKLIAKLQDQHQQDCIKINQLHVTIDTLVDKYSRLRKTAGVD